MRFRSIQLSNYRQYRDLELTFYQGKHDLQVIVADNGVGKTNLLNAFTWCLYGEEPHLGTSRKDAGKQRVEPKLNKEVIAEYAKQGLRIADVRVQIDIDDGSGVDAKLIRVVRQVPFNVSGNGDFFEKSAEERLFVTIIRAQGSDYPLEGESAQEYLNKLLPASIRRYFFFDGEQLNSYFKATEGDRIKEAVYSISRIDLIRTMIQRLDSVVKDQRRAAANTSSDTSKLEVTLAQKEQTLAGARNFIDEKNKEIAELQQKITEINDQLLGVPNVGELERQCVSIRRKRDDQQKRVNDAESAYYKFARERVVDFYLYPAVRGSLDRIRSLENDGQLPPSIDPGKLEAALAEGKCTVCGHELSEEERSRITQLLELYKVSSRTSNILSSMTSELTRSLNAVKGYPAERKRYIEALNTAQRELDELEDQLKDLEARAAQYADTGAAVKQNYEDRSAFQKQLEECSRQIGTRQSNIPRLETEIDRLKKKLADEAKKTERSAKLSQMVDFGTRALDVLKNAERAIVDETREKMAVRTEELFKGLVWKDSKCDRIELSSNYIPSLYDKSNFSCAGTCSAAERSLLALSFTLAMHEVSGFESPLFIDTPIARASGENRENFAHTLVEVSEGKQLILAFTPDEYSASIQNEFEPALATYIRLKLDSEETHILKPEVENRGN